MNLIGTVLPGLTSVLSIHPLLVHFPLGLLPVALLLQLLGLRRERETWSGHARVCLYLGTLGAIFAVAAGFLAANDLGHNAPGHDLVHTHRNITIGATLLAIGTSVLARRRGARPAARDRAVAIGLAVTTTVLALGADRGANLVYGHGMGVRHDPVAAMAPRRHDHDHHATDTGGAGHDQGQSPLAAGGT